MSVKEATTAVGIIVSAYVLFVGIICLLVVS